MTSWYAYTVTEDGKEYRTFIKKYRWEAVCSELGVSREQVRRGALASLPFYEKDENQKEDE